MKQEMIDRINTLYHKSKSVGLIEAIRTNMRANLNNISIQEKDGSITDLGKKYGNIKEV